MHGGNHHTMGWGHFGRSKRAQSLGSVELEAAGNGLGSRLASDDSVSTSQAWTQLTTVGPQSWTTAAAHPSQVASAQFANHRCAIRRASCRTPSTNTMCS